MDHQTRMEVWRKYREALVDKPRQHEAIVTTSDKELALASVAVGDWLLIETGTWFYRLRKAQTNENEGRLAHIWTIEGHCDYCPKPVKCIVHGSFIGAAVFRDLIALGCYLQYYTIERGKLDTALMTRVWHYRGEELIKELK